MNRRPPAPKAGALPLRHAPPHSNEGKKEMVPSGLSVFVATKLKVALIWWFLPHYAGPNHHPGLLRACFFAPCSPRVAQLLINDAESAIAEANPAIENDETRDRTGTVSPTLTDAKKQANYEMRTAADVWAGG